MQLSSWEEELLLHSNLGDEGPLSGHCLAILHTQARWLSHTVFWEGVRETMRVGRVREGQISMLTIT